MQYVPNFDDLFIHKNFILFIMVNKLQIR